MTRWLTAMAAALAMAAPITLTPDAQAGPHRYGRTPPVALYVALPGYPRLEAAVQRRLAARAGHRLALTARPRSADYAAIARLQLAEPAIRPVGRAALAGAGGRCVTRPALARLDYRYGLAVRRPGHGLLDRDRQAGRVRQRIDLPVAGGPLCRAATTGRSTAGLYAKLADRIAGDILREVRQEVRADRPLRQPRGDRYWNGRRQTEHWGRRPY